MLAKSKRYKHNVWGLHILSARLRKHFKTALRDADRDTIALDIRQYRRVMRALRFSAKKAAWQ